MKKTDKIYDYYTTEFKDDELGKELNTTITFSSVLRGMKSKKDIYDLIGVGDSIVRERIMGAIADLYYDGDYDCIYNLWLYGNDKKSISKAEKEDAYKMAMNALKN